MIPKPEGAAVGKRERGAGCLENMGFLRLACSYDSIYNHQLHTRLNLGSKVMDNSNHTENVDLMLVGAVFSLLFLVGTQTTSAKQMHPGPGQ